MHRTVISSALLCVLFASSLSAFAVDREWTWGIDLRGGVSFDEFSGRIRFDGRNQSTPFQDVQNDLKVDNSTSVRLGLGFRGERWEFEGGFQNISFDGVTRRAQTLRIGGTLFDVNTEIATTFEQNYYFFEGFYWFQRARTEPNQMGFAVGGGLHVYNFDYEAQGTSGGNSQSEARSRAAPLPIVGGKISQQLGSSFRLEFGLQGMYLPEVIDIQASMIDADLRASFAVTESLSFGAAIGYTRFQIDANRGEVGVDYEVLDHQTTSMHLTGIIHLTF